MRYKTLVRILLKILGVYFILDGGARFASRIGGVVFASANLSLPGSIWFLPLVGGAGVVVQLVAGFYLFFGGKWVANWIIPGNRPYCPECGYDLTGEIGGRCSECGTAFKAEDVEPRTDG